LARRLVGAMHRIARQWRAIERTLARTALPRVFRLAGITVACGPAYLDFRLSEFDWRARRPDLAAWSDEVAQRPSMQATKPWPSSHKRHRPAAPSGRARQARCAAPD
jgi:glutathione S-transferase